MSENFASPYTSTAMMSLMASLECLVVGAAVERKAAGWAVGWDIRLVAAFYTVRTSTAFLPLTFRRRMTQPPQGIVGSGFAFGLMSWCIQRRGPLFVSMFSPLLLVIVAVLGWAILSEKIYLGRLEGSNPKLLHRSQSCEFPRTCHDTSRPSSAWWALFSSSEGSTWCSGGRGGSSEGPAPPPGSLSTRRESWVLPRGPPAPQAESQIL